MTLRTPRRRISPRTKRKYRAVKNFLRKALGTPSQGDLGTNSSVEASVSDLQNKIQGLEQQLNNVSKHCHDLVSLEEKVRKESVKLLAQEDFVVETLNKSCKSDKHLNNESQLLYDNSKQDQNNDKSCKALNDKSHVDRNDMISYEATCSKNVSDVQFKRKKSKCRNSNEYFNERPNNIKSRYDTIEPAQLKSSFHSLIVPKNKENCGHEFSGYGAHKRRKGYIEAESPNKYEDRKTHQRYSTRNDAKYERQETSRRKKRHTEVDEEFIADIIKRQYKPVKLFSKTHSDFSQFSAPVCRDQEHRIREEIQEGSALCSCCFDEGRRPKYRYVRNSDISDIRSICDTRLYSSKCHRNNNKDIRRFTDDYNNSAFYDIVPVKEKSSPKSRRKFAEDNIMSYHCREVPPSPRSQRPRLNLKVQNYSEYEDGFRNKRDQIYNKSPVRQKYYRYESDCSESAGCGTHKRQDECFLIMKTHKAAQVQEEVGTTSSLQVANLPYEQINVSNNDTTLNTQVTDLTADKTDKTLGEIKDILQSFLSEIKKDSVHDKKSNTTSNINSATIDDKTANEDTEKIKTNTNTLQNRGPNWNCNTGPCSAPGFLPTFPNHCCYPIIPICPMNCLQNGYIMPNPSFTCTACVKNSKDNTCLERDCCNTKINASQEMNTSDETQELIKEIHKFVTQNSNPPRVINEYFKENNSKGSKKEQRILDKKLLTNRSVGGSTKTFKHDANVGTPNMKCYSKSCEAIGSRVPSDTYNTTNSSLSETVIDKLSLEATQSSTESDVSTDVLEEKEKRSKFKNLLRSLRLIKKKKDVIEEVSESESTVNVNVKQNPPFKQHIMSYAMHGQEYLKPPPISAHHCCRPHLHDHSHDYNQTMLYPPYIRDELYYNTSSITSHHNPAKYSHPPFCPNHDPCYNQVQQPQVPLCLKEIEVKSIGTQSVRKMSLFHKLANKVQQPVQEKIGQQYSAPPIRKKPTLWQTLQDKAKQQSTDPLDFSLKTQKQLAQGDMKMRNAMLKKLFYKRNPFSPRNLIVRTLLGKDKTSFGDPPKMYRPRMFL